MYLFELVGPDDAFACQELTSLISGVRRLAPGLALAPSYPAAPSRLAYTRAISDLLLRSDSSISAIVETLAATPTDRTGSVAVRARSIRGAGIDTQAAERALGAILVERGYEIDLEGPTHELRVVFSDTIAAAGWAIAEPAHSFAHRQPTKRPFFQPGSMAPRLARALVNLSGVDPGELLLDPMCGTGGILIESGRMGIHGIGTDVQPRMVTGARTNLDRYVDGAPVSVLQADASRLPFGDRAIDAVVLDVPYGRQSHIGGRDRTSLTNAVLSEAYRVSDRAVVVADRSLARNARDCGWTIRSHTVRRVHRSLDRHIHQLIATE